MNALLVDLLKCEMPYVDTRGRSTMVELSMSEIDRRFEGRWLEIDRVDLG